MIKLLSCVTLVLCLTTLSRGYDGSDSVLKSVVVVFRHGDRNIIFPYPNDPYGDLSYWPGGYGQLTNKGKKRHYKLGQWFRQRYQDFLPSTYSYYDILVRSSDYDRTLMSAQSHLAGLYPPKGDEIFEPDLPWQPIPVHTRPLSEDNDVAMLKPCPRHTLLMETFVGSDKYRPYWAEAKNLSLYISEHSGLDVNNFLQILGTYDTFFVEEDVGYELPSWSKAVYPQPLKKWAAFMYSISCKTPQLARLTTGPFLYEVIANFLNVTQQEDSSYQKYKIYSAHDTTVANILTTFGAFDNIPPPYASSVIFELRQNKDGYFVNVFYKNGTEPLQVSVNGCQFDCKLEDFVSVLKPVTISADEWEKECALVDGEGPLKTKFEWPV